MFTHVVSRWGLNAGNGRTYTCIHVIHRHCACLHVTHVYTHTHVSKWQRSALGLNRTYMYRYTTDIYRYFACIQVHAHILMHTHTHMFTGMVSASTLEMRVPHTPEVTYGSRHYRPLSSFRPFLYHLFQSYWVKKHIVVFTKRNEAHVAQALESIS